MFCYLHDVDLATLWPRRDINRTRAVLHTSANPLSVTNWTACNFFLSFLCTREYHWSFAWNFFIRFIFFWLYTAVSVLRARRNKTDRRKSLSRGRELDCTTFCSTGNNAGREAITQFSGCGASYGCNYWGQQTCLRFLTKLQNCETRCQFFLFFFHFCFERQMWSFRGSICETTMQSFISVSLCHRWVFLITMADGLKRTWQITLLNVKQTLDENKHCKKITPQTIVVARTTEQKKTD